VQELHSGSQVNNITIAIACIHAKEGVRHKEVLQASLLHLGLTMAAVQQ
jgi:hypothetical protein